MAPLYGEASCSEVAGRPQDRTVPGLLRPSGLEPAALGGHKDGLGAVDGSELAVDVVQVGAHGAGREGELVGDLLVDLALGQALEHLDLAGRERARVDLARA